MSFKHQYPYEIGTYFPDSKQNCHGFEIVVKNEPNVLHKIMSLFIENDIDIVNMIHSDISKDTVSIFIVGLFKENKMNSEEFLKKAKEILKSDLIEVSYSGKILDVYYSRNLFPLTLNKRRAILMGASNQEALVLDSRKRLGDDIGSSLLHHLGYNIGLKLFERFYTIYGDEIKDIDKLIRLCKLTLETHGWAKIVDYKIKKDKVVIDMKGLWECDIQIGVASFGSFYLKGIMKALIEKLSGNKTSIVESKCVSRGDKICRFEITLKS